MPMLETGQIQRCQDFKTFGENIALIHNSHNVIVPDSFLKNYTSNLGTSIGL